MKPIMAIAPMALLGVTWTALKVHPHYDKVMHRHFRASRSA